MPPRVREVKRLLRSLGYTKERPGKGDHTVFQNPMTGDSVAIDGADSHELTRPFWSKLRKRLGIA
jgi:predicted RNA binding protein YcfA (HicA-like mRNA interferase family)